MIRTHAKPLRLVTLFALTALLAQPAQAGGSYMDTDDYGAETAWKASVVSHPGGADAARITPVDLISSSVFFTARITYDDGSQSAPLGQCGPADFYGNTNPATGKYRRISQVDVQLAPIGTFGLLGDCDPATRGVVVGEFAFN